MKQLALSIAFCSILFITGCRKESINAKGDSSSIEFAKMSLFKHGFDTTGIYEWGKYFIVEKDILFPKSQLKTVPRQAYNSSSNLVDVPNQGNITIAIDNSMPSDGSALDWRNAIAQAISEYNNIPNSKIRMTLISGASADIIVKIGEYDPTYNQYMSPFTIAAAGFPVNGDVFPFIIINSNYINIPSNSTKKYNMVHELGHCIGFRHTNWFGRNESTGIGVGLSPNTGSNPDGFSVFNGGTATYSWNGFSSLDRYSISCLYPADGLTIVPYEPYTNYPTLAANTTYNFYLGDNAPSGAIQWTLPQGFTWEADSTSSSIYIKTPPVITEPTGTIFVTVTTDCGNISTGELFFAYDY